MDAGRHQDEKREGMRKLVPDLRSGHDIHLWAQSGPASWQNLNTLQEGKGFRCLKRTTRKVSGTFLNVSEAAISVQDQTGSQAIQRQDIVRVRLMKNKHRLRNAFIGAGVGAGVGAVMARTWNTGIFSRERVAGSFGGGLPSARRGRRSFGAGPQYDLQHGFALDYFDPAGNVIPVVLNTRAMFQCFTTGRSPCDQLCNLSIYAGHRYNDCSSAPAAPPPLPLLHTPFRFPRNPGPCPGLHLHRRFLATPSPIPAMSRISRKHKYGVRIPGPAADYTDGRFTDGDDTIPLRAKYFGVWIEQFAATLPSKPIIMDSLDGGTNYAYGFAFTGSGTSLLTLGSASLSVNCQQHRPADYRLSRHASRHQQQDSLCRMGGANDLLNATSADDVIKAGINQVTNIQRLIDAGATQFIIPNLPPLGSVPRLNGSPSGCQLAATAASVLYNRILSQASMSCTTSTLADISISPAGCVFSLQQNHRVALQIFPGKRDYQLPGHSHHRPGYLFLLG